MVSSVLISFTLMSLLTANIPAEARVLPLKNNAVTKTHKDAAPVKVQGTDYGGDRNIIQKNAAAFGSPAPTTYNDENENGHFAKPRFSLSVKLQHILESIGGITVMGLITCCVKALIQFICNHRFVRHERPVVNEGNELTRIDPERPTENAANVNVNYELNFPDEWGI